MFSPGFYPSLLGVKLEKTVGKTSCYPSKILGKVGVNPEESWGKVREKYLFEVLRSEFICSEFYHIAGVRTLYLRWTTVRGSTIRFLVDCLCEHCLEFE